MKDLDALREDVKQRYAAGSVMAIEGGGSRSFFGYPVAGDALRVGEYRGVIDYHPEELVLQVRAGTPLSQIDDLLRAEGQMLAFDPPVFASTSTVGGAVATGMSGSRRPYTGSVRDYVLGVSLILHDGEYLSFGGQVMKNVAGYDVSRLVCGSHGMLGVIADISLKVLPAPEQEVSISLQISAALAAELLERSRQRVNAISAACYMDGQLHLRLSGSESAVAHDMKELGGDTLGNDFWLRLDTQDLGQLSAADELWRLSTHPGEVLESSDCEIFDWGFAQRWLVNPASDPRSGYNGSGHWTRYRGAAASDSIDIFEPLTASALALHKRIKSVFDPAGLFNPGRMYREL